MREYSVRDLLRELIEMDMDKKIFIELEKDRLDIYRIYKVWNNDSENVGFLVK